MTVNKKLLLKLLLGLFITLIYSESSYGCHALGIENFQITQVAGGIEVDGSSNSATCGCDNIYWMDIEVRCVGEPFDGAPFSPGFHGPLTSYPYYQSDQMNKPGCQLTPYPTTFIPYSSMCPGIDYQIRVRENHNGDAGTWSTPISFTVPGTSTPLSVDITASDNNICAGNCTTLSANVIGGCGLAPQYTWSNGSNNPSINVCPATTTTYTVDVFEQCSNFSATATFTVNVLPNPVAGTASISQTTICEGQTVDLSLTGHSGTIQWQSAPSNTGPWSNMGGATTANETTPALNNDMCYRAVVSGCGPDAITNVVCVTVLPPGITALNCPGNLNAICALSEQPAYTSYTDFLNDGGSVTGDASRVVASTFNLVSQISDGNTCPEVVTRTYEVSDDCGNTESCTQTITINDNIDPSGTAPGNVTVQCIGDVPAVNTNNVTGVSDNCTANPTVTHVSDVSDNNSCPETITRTYRIQDDCGNFIDVNQMITVNDDIDPSGTAPGNITVQCIGNVPAANINDVAGVSDNCTANPTVSHVGDVSDNNSCPETITRTYRVEDDCGNFIEVDQIITVDDDTNPVGTAPGNITVQCIGDVPAPNTNDVTGVSDNCTLNPNVTFIADASDNNTCPETITRTYRIEDDCGNFTEVDQTITVNDDTDPIATAPNNVTVQCISDVPAVDVNDVTGVSDNCTANPTVTHIGDVSDGNTCPEIITRTYRIEDDCGNFIEVNQAITVDDNIDPTASNPSSITVSGGPAPAPDPTVVTTEADNCTANPSVTWVSDNSDGNTCPETITRTYAIEDDCGNQITVDQLIYITDPIDPTGTAPADISVQCASDVPVPDPTLITDASDNNGTPTVTWDSDVSDGNTCPEEITRTYRIEDPCGNAINVTQIITVNDDIDPSGTAPAGLTVQCIGDVPAADITDVTGVSDNCTATPTVTHVGDVSDGNTCPEEITRTYRVEDDCGNFIEVDQIITVNDDIDPAGTAPADLTVQCIGDVPAADINDVTGVSDNCTATPTVTHLGDVSDGNTCPEEITRTYRIEDDCGNSVEVDQIITVNDDIDPAGTAPADLTVQCIGDVPAADINSVTGVSDNCTTNPTVIHVGDVSDGNTCPEEIARTYRVEDDCGNFIEVDQIITVNDDTDPAGTAPADLTVQCIGDVPAADITDVTGVSDNCTATPTVTHAGDVSDGNTCPEEITRTYRVEDDCGNSIEVDQIITVNDDIDPAGTAPADLTVQCIGDVPAADINDLTGVSDNCTATPTVTHVGDISDGNTCPEEITRTYRIEDDCGNFIEVDQIITINDDTAPTASNPATTTVQCASDVPATDPTVVTDEADNCTANPTVTFLSETSDNNVCDGEELTRVYEIADDCGNTTTVTHTIIIDAYTPTFTVAGTDPTTCGGTDGFITISGLDPNTDYDLGYNGNATNPITTDGAGEYVITNLPAGSYTDFAINPTSCDLCVETVNTNINLVDPNAPPVDAGPDQTICDGETVTLTATNPNNVNISWNNGVTDGNAFAPPVGTNNYTVTAEEAGCTSTDLVVITVNPIPNVNAGNDVFICDGESVTLSASGADTYVWDNGVTDGVSFVPSATTTYSVTGSSAGCTATDDVLVTIYDNPDVGFEADVTEGCIPQEVNFTNQTTGNTSVCEWNIAGTTITDDCSPSYTFATPGCYNVSLTVTTDNGCVDNHTENNYICIDDYPVADFSADPAELTSLYYETEFDNKSVGAETYAWNFDDGETSTATHPSHTFPGEEEDEFLVELIATSQYGCEDTAYQTIIMREELLYYVPNSFTPDRDQFNEKFKPVFTSGFNPQDYTLMIFNRWGEIIFESNHPEVGWDGTYGADSEEIVKDGTYVWKIEFKTKYNDERKVELGHVNVLRQFMKITSVREN